MFQGLLDSVIQERREGGARRVLAVVVIALMLGSLMPVMPAIAAETSIKVRDPNGGETIYAGVEYDIEWQVSGSTGYIIVFLSVDSGRSYQRLMAVQNRMVHGIGYATWSVPPTMNETRCRVKVQWTDAVLEPITVYAEDESDADFSIIPGVAINFKEVPTSMSYGRYDLITFDLFDPFGQVGGLKFTWRVNDGSGYGGWTDLPGNYDYYDPYRGWIWWMPEYYQSATCEVKVEALPPHSSSALATDTTPEIDIASPTITLISPDGGVTLVGGTAYTVEWRTSSDPHQIISAIDVAYSINGGSTWSTVLIDTPDDGSEDWSVPSGVSYPDVLVRVVALYGERYFLADDISSSPNSIISSADTPSVTLVKPNPPVDGGEVIGSGETYRIEMSFTGSTHITSVVLSYSTDAGSTFTTISTMTQARAFYQWTAPAVDTYEARVKVVITLDKGGSKSVMSNHNFYIFDTIAFNRPPIADAGPDQQAMEGDLIWLDASGSYDQDNDVISYRWKQIQPTFMTVYLSSIYAVRPNFTVVLHHFPVTFVFEVELTDFHDHSDWPILYNTSRVTIEVDPRPPQLNDFVPDTGYAGTPLALHGMDMMGAEVVLGNTVVHTIPTEPVQGNPNPDSHYQFTLPANAPLGVQEVKIRTMVGEATTGGTIEIVPVPQWNLDYGLGFQNPSRNSLSYPWNPFGDHDGRYYDVFGNQVYLTLWVCIGIPYWTPWDGWECWGYLVDEPFAPHPLAAIYYGAVFWYMAQNGECFGMSTVALKYYHGELSLSPYEPAGATDINELANRGDFRELVDWRQGAQLSSEIINAYLHTLINGLIPSSDTTGMGTWISTVKGAIDSGELGIATMIEGGGGHAVVPYAYDEIDANTIRFYVYDCNQPYYSFEDKAIEAVSTFSDANDTPPYIEIDKSGMYWEWKFDWPDGSVWSGHTGLGFVPWDVVNGDRTMPLSIEGIINLLAGSAVSNVEDGEGNMVGYDEDGEMLWDIEGAAPMPVFGGKGYRSNSWYLPAGEYTTHIEGQEDGVYNWSSINDGRSAFWLEEAECTGSTEDTVSLAYEDDNPYRGWMRYGTSDEAKEYTVSTINQFGERVRVYRIKGATVTDDGEHGFGTNEDYTGIKFTNYGTTPVTFDVEFESNVITEALWNGTSPPVGPGLPSTGRTGITVGPGETVIIKPQDWLNLTTSLVIIEGETAPGMPTDLVAGETGSQVTLTWTAPDDDGGWPVLQYDVYRGDSAESLEFLGSTSESTYVDETSQRGSTYHYAVLAVNALGDGGLTVPVSIAVPLMTEPTAPLGILVVEAGGKVTLTWLPPADDGGSDITGYAIYRGTDPADLTKVKTVGPDTMTWVDDGVKGPKTYYYEVKATNSVGDGPPSHQGTVEVPKTDDGDGGLPWTLLLGIVIVVLAAIAVAAMMMRKRGGPEVMAPMDPGPLTAPKTPIEMPEGAAK